MVRAGRRCRVSLSRDRSGTANYRDPWGSRFRSPLFAARYGSVVRFVSPDLLRSKRTGKVAGRFTARTHQYREKCRGFGWRAEASAIGRCGYFRALLGQTLGDAICASTSGSGVAHDIDEYRPGVSRRLPALAAGGCQETCCARGEAECVDIQPGYRDGDPEAVAEYYRIDFGTTFKQPKHLARLTLRWTKEDILSGRAIEDRLMERLYWSEGFTIIPELKQLRNPTLIIHGDYDFVPVQCAARIAEAMSGAHLVIIGESGHFSYIDAPEEVRTAIGQFFANA